MSSKGKTLSRKSASSGHGKGGRACAGNVVQDNRFREDGYVWQIQRRRLLLGFADVLAERGLQDANVGRVCSRAGVSRRTFYDLFEDREACFIALLEEMLERVAGRLLSVYGSAGRWQDRIRAALTALLEAFDEKPALARAMLVESLRAGPEVEQWRVRALQALAHAVEEGRSELKEGVAPPPLTAQSTVGGAVSIVHARLLEDDPRPLIELLNPLMSMIVLPYLGPSGARRQLTRSTPKPAGGRDGRASEHSSDPFEDLSIRITFRTARVLAAIAAQPGISNRQVGEAAGVPDQGQISKLLKRLEGFGLIQNDGQGHAKGEPNAWQLTERGHSIQHTIAAPVG
jgi:AcrR family transcriptional regulator